VALAGAARGADDPPAEIRNFRFGRVAKHFDKGFVPTRRVKARCDQSLYAQLAHIAERHGLAGWVFWLHHQTHPLSLPKDILRDGLLRRMLKGLSGPHPRADMVPIA
jgi:hypothetical protein